MARVMTWLATRDDRGQGTVEYFLVILAATALAIRPGDPAAPHTAMICPAPDPSGPCAAARPGTALQKGLVEVSRLQNALRPMGVAPCTTLPNGSLQITVLPHDLTGLDMLAGQVGKHAFHEDTAIQHTGVQHRPAQVTLMEAATRQIDAQGLHTRQTARDEHGP